MIEKDYGTGVCDICGQTFKKANGSQRYCSVPCRREAQHQQNLEWMRRYREEMQQFKKKQEKKAAYSSFQELADMNERARAAGMSYGKYVALLREGRVQFGRETDVHSEDYRQRSIP